MKKPAIPAVDKNNVVVVLNALKENVEVMTGRRGSQIVALGTPATTAQIIAKINEIIGKLNASG